MNNDFDTLIFTPEELDILLQDAEKSRLISSTQKHETIRVWLNANRPNCFNDISISENGFVELSVVTRYNDDDIPDAEPKITFVKRKNIINVVTHMR